MTNAVVRAACHAMGTRFELVLHGPDEEHLRAAASQAADEIVRIHNQLNLFDPSSEVSEINRLAGRSPVRVDARLLELIEKCRALWEQTRGAFDITVGSLMQYHGFREPSSEQETPPPAWGMQLVHTDREAQTVSLPTGVQLDFGAVAKGYALDAVAAILRECRIEGALIHGGTSSILAIGKAPDDHAWRVAIRDPRGTDKVLQTIELSDEALAVSAAHGRIRRGDDGSPIGHIMDPRSGAPASGLLLAAVSGPSATECDALSTAVAVLGAALATELRTAGLRVWTYPA